MNNIDRTIKALNTALILLDAFVDGHEFTMHYYKQLAATANELFGGCGKFLIMVHSELMPITKSVKQNQSRVQLLVGLVNVVHSVSFPCCFATLIILTDYGGYCNRHIFYKLQ